MGENCMQLGGRSSSRRVVDGMGAKLAMVDYPSVSRRKELELNLAFLMVENS